MLGPLGFSIDEALGEFDIFCTQVFLKTHEETGYLFDAHALCSSLQRLIESKNWEVDRSLQQLDSKVKCKR
jgi:hypothetical protein